MPDAIWGLLPAAEGWQEWFAWRPVKACGRRRWLRWVQRRLVASGGLDPCWEYRAGRAHDYPDSTIGAPLHFVVHSCRHCGARFWI